MARRLAMSVLVKRCKRRADKENDDHIGTPEWQALISEVFGELYETVAETGMRYFETESTITATGAASYTEPDALLSFIGIDFIVNAATGERRPLRELMVQERHALSGQTGEAVGYAFVDDQIFLYPRPSTGTYKLLHVPQSPDLTDYGDADLVDVVCAAGEAFLVWGVACLAKDKGEVNLEFALMQRDRSAKRLAEWAVLRALNEPRRPMVDQYDTLPMEGDYR